jgi:membrane protein
MVQALQFKRSMSELKTSWNLLKKTAEAWNDDQAMTLSAALSYYTVFSITPLILITLAIVGFIYGEEASRGQIFSAVRDLFGDDGAKGVEAMVQASSQARSGFIATIIGVVTLLFGASSVFGQLQSSLNIIWKVQPKPGRGVLTFIRQRFLSFSMTLVIAFLLLVSLVLSTVISAIGTLAHHSLPGGETIWHFLNLVISFGFTTLLFAAIYKILPDVEIGWKDVWSGAAFTSLFFSLGKFLIGLYIGHSGVASTFGAAGSAVIILVWAYYSSAILLFGSEYTRVKATYNGQKVPLKDGAEWLRPVTALRVAK